MPARAWATVPRLPPSPANSGNAGLARMLMKAYEPLFLEALRGLGET